MFDFRHCICLPISSVTNSWVWPSEASTGVQLPTADSAGAAAQPTSKPKAQTVPSQGKEAVAAADGNGHGLKLDTRTHRVREHFVCSLEDLYRCFTDREVSSPYLFIILRNVSNKLYSYASLNSPLLQMLSTFTNSKVTKLELERGGRFVLFDGLVEGEFMQLVMLLFPFVSVGPSYVQFVHDIRKRRISYIYIYISFIYIYDILWRL